MDAAAADPVEEPSSPRVRRAGLVLAPLVFAALLLVPLEGLPDAARGLLAVSGCVAVLWLTQAIPIAAASLVPLVLVPLLGIATTKRVAALYVNDNTFLFLGGFLLAIAIERCGLHRRIAARVIAAFGKGPRRLSLGFMLLSAGLSCWISNTATTLMLLPMGLAVIAHVAKASASDPADPGEARSLRNFSALLLLSIAYGASIGGLGTPVGTPPNALFFGQVSAAFPDRPELQISFARWMAAMIPLVFVFAPLAWLLVERFVLPTSHVRARLGRMRAMELPAMGRDERVVAAAFAATALLWIFRVDIELGALTIPGWASALGIGSFVQDGTIAILTPLLLFLVPSAERPGGRLLDWSVEPRIPWGVLLLFGAGFAIAGLFEDTGLAKWSGDVFAACLPANPLLAVAMTAAAVTLMSELANNTATAAVLLPIAASVAISAELHPFLLMVPVTVAASCGFALPVATAPNAIVFATGRITVGQMARAGLLLDLLGIALITLFAATWWRVVLW
jgi:sodium-dependent dicarboxylate transporter 2/3/5